MIDHLFVMAVYQHYQAHDRVSLTVTVVVMAVYQQYQLMIDYVFVMAVYQQYQLIIDYVYVMAVLSTVPAYDRLCLRHGSLSTVPSL